MRYYGKPKIIKNEERKCEYIRCDVCDKKIKNREKYFEVTTSHNDWGNDSVDSIRYKDVCVNCINKFVEDYLEEYKNSNTAEIEIESNIFIENHGYYGDYDEFDSQAELVENDKESD